MTPRETLKHLELFAERAAYRAKNIHEYSPYCELWRVMGVALRCLREIEELEPSARLRLESTFTFQFGPLEGEHSTRAEETNIMDQPTTTEETTAAPVADETTAPVADEADEAAAEPAAESAGDAPAADVPAEPQAAE